MPAPATHIILALIVTPMLPDKDKKEFILGTSFPDIRYSVGIERNRTHNEHATWNSVQHENSSFKAGMDFHVLVDRIHEQFMLEKKVYDLIYAPNQKMKAYLFKFYEDVIFYDYIATWDEIISCFDVVLDEELNFGISRDAIASWHQMLKNYLLEKPTVTQVLELIGADRRLAHFIVPECLDIIIPQTYCSQIEKIVQKFYEQFSALFIKFESDKNENL